MFVGVNWIPHARILFEILSDHCSSFIFLTFFNHFSKLLKVCDKRKHYSEYCTCILLWSECLSLGFICRTLDPKVLVGAFEKWLGHENRVLMNGVSAFIKEVQEDPLRIPPCKDTVRGWRSAAQKRDFTRVWPCWLVDLGLPSLHNCKKLISVAYKLSSL